MLLNASIFKMQLHRASASATILALSTRSVSTSIAGEISATGGYAAHGRTIPGPKWTAGVSVKIQKFAATTAGLVFTASGAALNNIKYMVLRNSTSATGGKLIGFCTLSTAAFTIALILGATCR